MVFRTAEICFAFVDGASFGRAKNNFFLINGSAEVCFMMVFRTAEICFTMVLGAAEVGLTLVDGAGFRGAKGNFLLIDRLPKTYL